MLDTYSLSIEFMVSIRATMREKTRKERSEVTDMGMIGSFHLPMIKTMLTRILEAIFLFKNLDTAQWPSEHHTI